MSSITVILPFPPPELSPNSRCGWRAKAAVAQAYRSECATLATNALRMLAPVVKPDSGLPVEMIITFVLKDKRRRDWDNLLASIKAGIDGIVDAGLLFDDDVRSWTPTLRYEQGKKACIMVELKAFAL